MNRGTLFAVAFDPAEAGDQWRACACLTAGFLFSTVWLGEVKFHAQWDSCVPQQRDRCHAAGNPMADAGWQTQLLMDKPGLFQNPHISPDGQRLAVGGGDLTNRGIWIYDLQRDTLTRLTSEPDFRSVWTPDGKYVVYGSDQGMSWMRTDGDGKRHPLTQSKDTQYPTSFSPDGKRLAFHQDGAQGFDLWTVSIERDGDGLKAGTPELFLQTPFTERDASFSSDGRWLVYDSNESGNLQVYVRALSRQRRPLANLKHRWYRTHLLSQWTRAVFLQPR